MRASVRYCGQTIMKSPSLRASARDCGQLLLLGHGAMDRKLHLQSTTMPSCPALGWLREEWLGAAAACACGLQPRLRTPCP